MVPCMTHDLGVHVELGHGRSSVFSGRCRGPLFLRVHGHVDRSDRLTSPAINIRDAEVLVLCGERIRSVGLSIVVRGDLSEGRSLLKLGALVHFVVCSRSKVGHIRLCTSSVHVFLVGDLRRGSLFSSVGRDIAGSDGGEREVNSNVAVPA